MDSLLTPSFKTFSITRGNRFADRRFAVQDGAAATRSPQRRDTTDVIEVNVGDDQSLNTKNIEPERRRLSAGYNINLFNAAVNGQTDSLTQMEPMAGAGYAASAAVMGNNGEIHVIAHSARPKMKDSNTP